MAFNLPSLRRKSEGNQNRDQGDIINFFDSFFNDFYSIPTFPSQNIRDSLSPRTNISETDKEYYLELELPGMSKKILI